MKFNRPYVTSVASKNPTLFYGTEDRMTKTPTATTEIKEMQLAALSPPMTSKDPVLFRGSMDSTAKTLTPTAKSKGMQPAFSSMTRSIFWKSGQHNEGRH